MCFIICDWKISFNECFLKLGVLKEWNVQVSDCWFNNVKPPKYQMNHWSFIECKLFRSLCAIHNQLTNFKLYPDLSRAKKIYNLLNQLKSQTKLSI